MNKSNVHLETACSAPPPGWLCATGTYLSDSDTDGLSEHNPAHSPFGEILEQHAWAKGNQTSQPTLDGISRHDPFSNGSAESIHTEIDPAPVTDTARPGSSLRLSLWGMSVAKKLGQEPPTHLGGSLDFPRSNALVRRYTQWHTVHPQ